MPNINVVAAIVIRTNRNGTKEVFATQRGYGALKGGWEFPGGKIEQGETPQEALVREIREELATEVEVGECVGTVEYDYPTFHLSMTCFVCDIVSGNLELREHAAAKWLDKSTLRSVNWLPADILILDKIERLL